MPTTRRHQSPNAISKKRCLSVVYINRDTLIRLGSRTASRDIIKCDKSNHMGSPTCEQSHMNGVELMTEAGLLRGGRERKRSRRTYVGFSRLLHRYSQIMIFRKVWWIDVFIIESKSQAIILHRRSRPALVGDVSFFVRSFVSREADD